MGWAASPRTDGRNKEGPGLRGESGADGVRRAGRGGPAPVNQSACGEG